MNTRRSQLDRVLDEKDTGLSLDTLSRAAKALGYQIQIELVIAQTKKPGKKSATAKR